MELASGEQYHGVQIAITDAVSEVTGLVLDAGGRPVAHAGVLIFAQVPLFWMRSSRRMRAVHAGSDGRWSVAGLPAGEYLAFAARAIDERDLGRRERLEALRSIATPFRLTTDEGRASVTLRIGSVVASPVTR